MYGIFTYIYPTNDPNVGKYTIHGWSGYLDYLFENQDLHPKEQESNQDSPSHQTRGFCVRFWFASGLVPSNPGLVIDLLTDIVVNWLGEWSQFKEHKSAFATHKFVLFLAIPCDVPWSAATGLHLIFADIVICLNPERT